MINRRDLLKAGAATVAVAALPGNLPAKAEDLVGFEFLGPGTVCFSILYGQGKSPHHRGRVRFKYKGAMVFGGPNPCLNFFGLEHVDGDAMATIIRIGVSLLGPVDPAKLSIGARLLSGEKGWMALVESVPKATAPGVKVDINRLECACLKRCDISDLERVLEEQSKAWIKLADDAKELAERVGLHVDKCS